jgi:ankyrin repeat protein
MLYHFCSSECARILLENGADANLARNDGRTALHVAASDGQVRSLMLLFFIATYVA